MKELIDKITLVEEIEKRIKETESMKPKFDQFWAGQISAFKGILKILDTFEVKEVDLDEIARHYLLHEHTSPLNEVLHQADLNTEMQYHKDIENAYKAGVELGLKAKGEIYVVTRSEEHSDYVEAAFLSESKAKEYCKPFNEDENSYARDITEVEIQ